MMRKSKKKKKAKIKELKDNFYKFFLHSPPRIIYIQITAKILAAEILYLNIK